MAKGMWIGVGGVARKGKKAYLGVSGVARKIKKMYLGVSGVARLIFSGGELEYVGTATPLTTGVQLLAGASTANHALFAGGDNSGNYTSISTVNTYDKSLTKGVASNLSVARCMLVSGMVGDYALFAGGVGTRNAGASYANVDAYNSSLTRSAATNRGVAGGWFASARTGQYVIFAGCDNSSRSALVDAYNTSLTKSTPTPLNAVRGTSAGVSVGVYALVAGGNGNYQSWTKTSTDVVEAYNQSLTKSIPTALSARVDRPRAAAVGDYALINRDISNVSTQGYDVYNTALTRSTISANVSGGIAAAFTLGDFAIFPSTSNSNPIVEVIDKSLTKRNPLTMSWYSGYNAAAVVGDYGLVAGSSLYSTYGKNVDVFTA